MGKNPLLFVFFFGSSLGKATQQKHRVRAKYAFRKHRSAKRAYDRFTLTPLLANYSASQRVVRIAHLALLINRKDFPRSYILPTILLQVFTETEIEFLVVFFFGK